MYKMFRPNSKMIMTTGDVSVHLNPNQHWLGRQKNDVWILIYKFVTIKVVNDELEDNFVEVRRENEQKRTEP